MNSWFHFMIFFYNWLMVSSRTSSLDNQRINKLSIQKYESKPYSETSTITNYKEFVNPEISNRPFESISLFTIEIIPNKKMFGIIYGTRYYFFSRDILTRSIRPSSIESTSMRSGQNLSISPSRGNLSSRSMIK